MKAHELANKLLRLPDLEVEVITNVDGEYCETKVVTHYPWVFMDSTIRIQTMATVPVCEASK